MTFLIVSGSLAWFIVGMIMIIGVFDLNLHRARTSKVFLLTFVCGGPLLLIVAGIAELHDLINSSRLSNKLNDWLEK